MAEQAAFPKERLEDVFQDEIIKAFVNITSFEKFARSKNGLCLDQAIIQTIVKNHGGNVERQKMEMCFKWREIHGEKATVPNIRHLVQKYFRIDSLSDYVVLENGIFGVYKTVFLCERSKIYLGVQKSEVAGTQIRAIKFVPKNEKNLREAQILVKLGNHVNVVTTLHAGIHKGEPHDYIYIAMELSWTRTVRNMLEECMGQRKPFHEFIAWSLVEQLMRAVEFLHSHNIIHRDVKPDNILASDDWRHFKLTDYGLSKVIQDGFATHQTGANIGTLGYRSRETYILNVKITAKVDIFSAGVTIGEIMANGKHPFGQDQFLWSYNIFNNKNLDLSHLCVSYKDQVTYFIKRMLEMDPEKRPTAKKVLHDVSVYFQTFQLKNPQTIADEPLATTSKAITELYITEKVLTGTTADESPATTSKTITEPSITEKVLTGTTADESIATTSTAMTELSITEKEKVKATRETSKVAKKAEVTQELAAVEEPAAKDEQVDKPVKDEPKEHKKKRKRFSKKPAKVKEEVNAIIMFNESDKHMYSFNLSTKELRRMQKFPEYDSDDLFTTVVSGKHICFIQSHKFHQLEYSDPAAEWKEMSSMRGYHGEDPPAAMWNVRNVKGVLWYDIQNNSWCEIKLTQWPFEIGSPLAVDDKLYIIGPIKLLVNSFSHLEEIHPRSLPRQILLKKYQKQFLI